MDHRDFDQLARSIATATNRRDFMRRLFGVAGVTGGIMALSTQKADAARRGFSGPKLPQPPVDPDPCGIVESPCSANSQCCTNFCEQDLGGGGTCQICDATICGDFICTDLQWDPFNCGSCGNLCGPGASCNNGNCQSGV